MDNKAVRASLLAGCKKYDNGSSIPSDEWIRHVKAHMYAPKTLNPINAVVAQLEEDREEQLKTSAIPKELYLGWDALDKGGKLAKIKASNYTLYCVLYWDKFGKYPEKDSMSKIDVNVKKVYDDALRDEKLKKMQAMKWDDLMKANLTGLLKTLDPAAYRDKYYKKFGVYPKF